MHRKSRFFITGLVVLVLTSLSFGQASQDDKYRIQPTLDKNSSTGVLIPANLDAALLELDHILTPKLRFEMKAMKDDMDLVGEYHMGLGMWMRNNWGLWKDSQLATWFRKSGIRHPDDMSSVVLVSYWRKLNGKPIEFAKQVAAYTASYKRARIEADREEARVRSDTKQIRSMIVGAKAITQPSQTLALDGGECSFFRGRYCSLFDDELLLTYKNHLRDSSGKNPGFETRSLRFLLRSAPTSTADFKTLNAKDGVVIDGHAFIRFVESNRTFVMDWTKVRETYMPDPNPGTFGPIRQLGIDHSTNSLLIFYDRAVFTYKDIEWTKIAQTSFDLPICTVPPERWGERIYFRDEGRGEDDKRLSWLTLGSKPKLTYFDEHIGVVGESGPRWENVFSYSIAPKGDVWICTGSLIGGQSLIHWVNGKYQILMINDNVKWDGELLGDDFRESGSEHQMAISAVQAQPDNSVLAAGPHGLYEIKGNTIRRTLAIVNAPRDWVPSTIFKLDDQRLVVCGHFGSTYMFRKDGTGKWTYEKLK